MVSSVLVRITEDWDGSVYTFDDASVFYDMFERPSWTSDDGTPSWWEHLMWRGYKNSYLPLSHIIKYDNDEEAKADWDKYIKGDL